MAPNAKQHTWPLNLQQLSSPNWLGVHERCFVQGPKGHACRLISSRFSSLNSDPYKLTATGLVSVSDLFFFINSYRKSHLFKCTMVKLLVIKLAHLLTCRRPLLVDRMPMEELGSTCSAREESLFIKARALWRETCFLRFVSISSRHWRAMSVSSFVEPGNEGLPQLKKKVKY